MNQQIVIQNQAIHKLKTCLGGSDCFILVRGSTSFVQTKCCVFFDENYVKHNYVEIVTKDRNPKLETIENWVLELKAAKRNFKYVVAIGGGSVIDSAKIIAYKLNKATSFLNNIPIIAVPTTVGTGSESTCFAVYYVGFEKFSLEDKSLLPQIAILDSQLVKDIPYEIAVYGILDAFSQSIESIWSVRATRESTQYAYQALDLLLENIFTENPKFDRSKIDKYQLAANLAGRAINISKTTAAHALSYPVTSILGLPHGYAVFLVLGEIFSLNAGCNSNPTIEHLKARLKISDNSQINKYFVTILEKLALSPKFPFGTNVEAIDKMLQYINEDRLSNNPAKVSKKQIRDIYLQLIL